MGNYRLSENAEADLYRIWLYGLERWGLEQASTYYAAFMQHFVELADNPLLHPAVDDIRPGYRRSVCGSDSVYYRMAEQTVEIMAIIGKQDTDGWL
ncbi:MAG: type II toxin-antitoxin system RelE/ParE family toxin [Gammaproteobacteria bacterium]|nr:type II toxin-antitoxin system RelE/ParE family toxin [Gammaproteobacteria bacterium]